MQKLEEGKTIKRYRADLDFSKLDFMLAPIITFNPHAGKSSAFSKHIEKLQEVIECYGVTGSYCFFMKIIVKAPRHLEELIKKFSEYGEDRKSVV